MAYVFDKWHRFSMIDQSLKKNLLHVVKTDLR